MTKSLGQNWILLRGLTREAAHWGDFVPLLQSTFPDTQISLLDLPGVGRFYKGTSPTTVTDIMEKVRYFALDQGLLHQPVTILALSLGAMIAWEWMLAYPDDICGATLVGTSFGDLSPFYHRLRWQSYGKIAALVMQKNIYARELAILQLVSNRRDQDKLIADQWHQIQKERPVSVKNIYRQILAGSNYQPDDRRPIQPVLLLNSKGDRLVASECSEAIRKKWDLELKTHPWAGHDLPIDDGLWVLSQLKNWIQSK
jgi:pimeloyl-ACP methyl ester carboxylesterase